MVETLKTGRRRIQLLCLIVLGSALSFSSYGKNNQKISKFPLLEKGFKQIPDSIQTSVYWYWISDHISREGVVKDLKAMKAIGINRAFIGNIAQPNMPYGKVKVFSDEWWNIIHTTLKTATELGIEIGMFNCPGWSQSGGPWVKPEQAMRYLALSEKTVTGPLKLKTKLAKTSDNFQDVKVIAYPVPEGSDRVVNAKNAKISSLPVVSDIDKIADGDQTTEVTIPQGGKFSVEFNCNETETIRSISVAPAHRSIALHAELYAGDGSTYSLIKSFEVNRTNEALNVGFNPYGPIVISLPKVSAKSFRLILTNANANSGISEITLTACPMEERYVEKTLAKMHQTPLPYWPDYLWPEQTEVEDLHMAIDPSKVVDITDKMDKDGTITWNVPEGNWKIIRSGMVPTGTQNAPASVEATGLETDKMSKKHIASHFDAFLGEIMKRIPAQDRKTWKLAVEDSYETGGQNWTDGFVDEFKQKYGYSPVPYIPVFNGYVVGSRALSDRFLWDLRRLIADKVAYDYVGGLRDVCHKNGLKTWLEAYGHWGFPGEFLQYGGQSDEVGGEFWSEGDLGNIENRAASSSAHIYGKQKVSAESFTCGGPAFSRYPENMKQRGDRFFTEGINNTLLHVYIEQPYDDKFPGVNAEFGNEFNRHNTWFNDLDLFIHYMKRCNLMLQQGKYVADAAYFIGEDAPKMTGVCDPALPKGYSFDYINSEVILNRAKVKNGCLVLPDGMTYRVLVLPKLETMRPELLRKISSLVNEGVIVLGPAPKQSPSMQNYPNCDKDVIEQSTLLWGDVDGTNVKQGKRGKGMILSGMSMQEAFDLLKIKPDLKVEANDPVLFIHRTLPEGDIYFLSNQSDQTITVNPEFRITGKAPELWNAIDGTHRDLKCFVQSDGVTKIPMKLSPYESAFIVFRKQTNKSFDGGVDKNYPNEKMVCNFTTPWTVQFDAKQRGPVNPVQMSTLFDWTTSSNDSIKYYSGTAVYKNEFNLSVAPVGKSMYLDLGKLTAMAKVKVNGIYVGGVWTAPWRVDISKAIRKGKNTVEISVVNTWVNRLIGDQKLPEDQRKTWCLVNPYNAESNLQPSGLVGPVTVSAVQYE